jgi:hypothetical protein
MCDGITLPWKFSRYFVDTGAIEKFESERDRENKKRERETPFSSIILYSGDFFAVHMGKSALFVVCCE